MGQGALLPGMARCGTPIRDCHEFFLWDFLLPILGSRALSPIPYSRFPILGF